MLRRSVSVLGPQVVPYHEWTLHEPLLKDYEGWRILDNNVKMTLTEAYITDIGGVGRHLDPIIDDPRLTHSQRVCRLYRWSLKELKCQVVKLHAGKFNLACKVVRNRFEKYRYVTDPATCDMMVRETQKYLRDTCGTAWLRTDCRSPNGVQNLTHPMFHPDNCLVYDINTPAEVMWYDDAKMHRYVGHSPAYGSTIYEAFDRFGYHWEVKAYWRGPWMFFTTAFILYWAAYACAFFHTPGHDDPNFAKWAEHFSTDMRQTIEAEERRMRGRYTTSYLDHDWKVLVGDRAPQKDGLFAWWPVNQFRGKDDPARPLNPRDNQTNLDQA